LTVVYGSHRHDVGRLLIEAVERWPYPVLFLEHKLLYGEVQDPADYAELPVDPGDLAAHLFPTLVRRRDDPDVTVLTYGGMLPVVERAVRQLEDEEELAVEVIAPSLLSPLPGTPLLARLLASPRVVIAEESHHDFGVSAEIAARLLEAGYRGKLVRVGAPPVPIASARSLERQILPDETRLVAAVLGLFR
jgi:2-oxoisovalerate dehydrogenase E1 component